MPKPAPARGIETGRDGGSCRRILPQKEAANGVVRDIRIVQLSFEFGARCAIQMNGRYH